MHVVSKEFQQLRTEKFPLIEQVKFERHLIEGDKVEFITKYNGKIVEFLGEIKEKRESGYEIEVLDGKAPFLTISIPRVLKEGRYENDKWTRNNRVKPAEGELY